jgi:hypothetical protein
VSNLIYGCHEAMPSDVMPDGWILFLAEVGHSSDPHPGIDFTPWSSQGYGIICRIQHAWNGGGTLPLPADLPGYLQRVESLVRNSRGCDRWQIANETNHPQELPDGHLLSPEYVGQVYNACHDIIAGEVILAPVAPWYVTADGIDWIEYFKRLIAACHTVDAFALHTYSRGPDPSSITSEDKMDPPYQAYHNGFRTYRDWLAAIPTHYRDRPTYITETNQNEPWLNLPNTWVQAAYREINEWNQNPAHQTIRALILYRWPHHDQWYIEGKQHVIGDFQLAQQHRYQWTEKEKPPMDELQNGTFDGAWIEQDGIPQLKVFVPWRVWWDEEPGDGHIDRPEAAPIGEAPDETTRRRSPPTAQKVWNNNATHRAGLHQTVQVDAGKVATFRIWFRQETTETNGGQGYAKIGIDPTGGTDAHSPDVVWSEDVWESYADFAELEISAVSQGNVTVFTFAEWKWPAAWNDTYWDDATLVVSGDPPIDPPTGTYTVVVYDPAGNVVVSCPFEAGTVNPQICAHAQAIVDLSCPAG